MAWLIFVALIIIFGIVLALSLNMETKPAEGFINKDEIDSILLSSLLNMTEYHQGMIFGLSVLSGASNGTELGDETDNPRIIPKLLPQTGNQTRK